MKICILHKYPKDQIKQTNAVFPYLLREGVEVKTFKKFNRLNDRAKFIKSLLWIFYAPLLIFWGSWEKVVYRDLNTLFPVFIYKPYDVIYCDDSFPFYPLLVKLMSPRSKVIIRLGDLHLLYYCSGWLYKILHWLEKIEWRTVDRIFAISGSMAEYIFDEVKRPVDVFNDPIDPVDFEVSDKKIVMFHGLLTRNKNIDILLEAARCLPQVDFWIVGDGADRKRLESLASNNFSFLGWQPFKEMGFYISQCDVGVALRSDNPGNEYVVTSPFLQYLVMGKPCIVSRRKVFEDMDYPYQFSNIDELIILIKHLLNNPQVGKGWQEYVLKYHNAKEIADGIFSNLKSKCASTVA